jgi:nitrogen fixation/metabolism regulation signal transduction histidine kinase
MKTTDDLILETISQGMQATFEALNDLARDLSEARKKQLHAKTERVQRARAHVEALLDERRAGIQSGHD